MDVLSLLLEPKFWIGFLLVVLYAIYRYGTRNYNVFSDNGIPGPKPLPFIGNMWGIWKKSTHTEDTKNVKTYGNVCGFYEGQKPIALVADPEIIKKILIKDFDHFMNHSSIGGIEVPIFSKMVFVLNNNEWKDVRSSITPAFSSGRIKKMTSVINRHVDQKVLKLTEEAKNGLKVDSMRMFSEITVGVIAESAFGMRIDDLGSEDSEFLKHATNLLGTPEDQAALTSYVMLIPYLFPSVVAQFIGNNATYKFFIDVVRHVVKTRSETNEKFDDFLSLFDELLSQVTMEKDGKTVKRWTGEALRDIISAQGLEFMIDGYAGTAMSMASLVYRLGVHPEIQEKLYAEITDKLDTFGEVSNDMIQELPYLDQFVNEVMRMHVVTPRLDRMCCKDITYDGFTIKKGVKVQIPVYYLHYSEEHFPNPKNFDPDRWSPENKSNIKPFTYLPFGGGPRGCIGSRFALQQMKLVICTFISKFEFYPVEETMTELKLKPGYGFVCAPESTMMGIKPRTN